MGCISTPNLASGCFSEGTQLGTPTGFPGDIWSELAGRRQRTSFAPVFLEETLMVAARPFATCSATSGAVCTDQRHLIHFIRTSAVQFTQAVTKPQHWQHQNVARHNSVGTWHGHTPFRRGRICPTCLGPPAQSSPPYSQLQRRRWHT